MYRIRNSLLLKSLAAFAIGMLTTLAFAPFNIAFLAFLCPAILLFLWQAVTAKQAALIGWCYGFGLFITGTWWIYISMHNFGHLAPPFAILATILLASYMAIFFALTGALVCSVSTSGAIRSLLLFPAAWVLMEWLRSTLFTGFHWLVIGYSGIDAPLWGYAPLIGVYGISFLTILSAGVLYEIRVRNSKYTQLLLLIAVIYINGFLLQHIEFTHPNGKKLNVAMTQGNIPQEYKWQPEKAESIVEVYDQLTKAHWDADLILWPEAAIPMMKHEAAPYLNDLDQIAKAHQKTVLIGIPLKEDNLYYNGLILLGQSQGQYAKRHLIPFGEYTPFSSLLDPLMLALSIPMSSFSSGAIDQPLLVVNNIHLAPFICYEIVEPDEVRRSLQHAEMIVTISDDSWFDGSIASEQHLQMARMRSLENGMPQLFLSSRGASAIISADGKIIETLGEHQRGVLTHTMNTVVGKTPWRSVGSYPILFFCCLVILGTIGPSIYRGKKLE